MASGNPEQNLRVSLRRLESSQSYIDLYDENIENYQQIKARLASDSSGISITRPDFPLENFVGLDEVKSEVLSYIAKASIGLFPFNPKTCSSLDNADIADDRILLFGESGTGKQHLARAIATNLRANLIEFKPLDFSCLYKWEFNLEMYTRAVYAICHGSPLSILLLSNIHCRYGNKEEYLALLRFLKDAQLAWRKNNARDVSCRLAIVATTSEPYNLEADMVNIFECKLMLPPTLNFKERKQLLAMTIQRKWKAGHLIGQKDYDNLIKKIYGIPTREIEWMVDRAIEAKYSTEMPLPANLERFEFMRNIIEQKLQDNFKLPLTIRDFQKGFGTFSRVDLTSESYQKLERFQKCRGNGPFMKVEDREHYDFSVSPWDTKGKKKRRGWAWNVASWL